MTTGNVVVDAPRQPGTFMPGGRLGALRSRDFSLFFGAALLSNIGTWMQAITVPAVLFAQTGQAKWLGYATFAQLGPGIVIGPYASVAADRFQRRKVVLVSQAFQGIGALGLWVMWVTHTSSAARILILLALIGLSGAIGGPSWQSLVPLLAPPEDLLSAVRLNAMQFSGSRAIGPAIGGLVYANFGPSWAFFVNGLSYVLVVAAMAVVRPRPQPLHSGEKHVLRDFADGLRYIRRTKALQYVILGLIVSVFFAATLPQLAAAFATDMFHVSRTKYGLLVTAYGLGSLLALVVLTAIGDVLARSHQAVAGFVISLVGFGLLAVAHGYGMGVLGFFVAGVGFLTVGNALQLAMQVRVSEQYRGRVGGIYLITFQGTLPLGVLALGALSDRVGLREMLVVSSIVFTVYVVLLLVRSNMLVAFNETVADDD
ncbi:MAG: MFS transporter [Acidimicrobiia bacterium]